MSESLEEPAVPADFDRTAYATSSGSSGGMVSSARDLHTLFTAVFDGQVVSAQSLTEMIENPRPPVTSELGNQLVYGLGIMLFEALGGRAVDGLVGHEGWTAGYLTLVAHEPDAGMTAFWVATNEQIDASATVSAVGTRTASSQ